MKTSPRLPSLLRRGFTLIELLAVMLIIGLLAVALTPVVTDAFDRAEVQACQANLREVYKGMLVYKDKYKRAPSESGVRFFAELISKGALENTNTNAKRLTCPGIDPGALAQKDLAPKEWWTDLDRIDGTWSAYAGRDTRSFPLRKFPGPGDEPLMSDDNDPDMNHATTTNVLYADASVQTYELETERENGNLGPDEEVLIVGPDSPIEDLRKMSLD